MAKFVKMNPNTSEDELIRLVNEGRVYMDVEYYKMLKNKKQ